jgi:glycosyltransferase involved in cell wall biosynthesis
MRLLYVIDSLAAGGAESSLAALAPHYVAAGVNLDVAYLRDRRGLQQALIQSGARTFCLDGRGGRAGAVGRIKRLLDELQPDLVHTTLFEADVCGRAAARLGRRTAVSSLVNAEYGPEQLNDPGLQRWKVRATHLLDAVTARSVVRWHAITSHVADVMAVRLRIDRRMIDVIPRGRDAAALGVRSGRRRAAAREALGVGSGDAVVLAAARHERQKGLDVLLEAWPDVVRKIPAARLFIAGRDGNQSRELRALVDRAEIGSSVVFLGARDDVPELLCAADAFAFPSRWEGLGSVLLEVMALETPIVASDLPPIRETVRADIDALLVPSEAPTELAGALVSVLSNRARAADLARRARGRFLDHYTIERVADGMLAFYDRAVSSGSGPRPKVKIIAVR